VATIATDSVLRLEKWSFQLRHPRSICFIFSLQYRYVPRICVVKFYNNFIKAVIRYRAQGITTLSPCIRCNHAGNLIKRWLIRKWRRYRSLLCIRFVSNGRKSCV